MELLEQIDVDLLNAIYEKDYNHKKIDWEAIGFKTNNQKAFHLHRLERNNLIEIDDNALVPGGQRDPQYGTAVVMVWSEGIHIKENGIEIVKDSL